MADPILSREERVYWAEGGIGGTPSWQRIIGVRRTDVPLSRRAVDVTTRDSQYASTLPGVIDFRVELELVATLEQREALRAAHVAGAKCGWAIMLGDIGDPDTPGVQFEGYIVDLRYEGGTDDAQTLRLSIAVNAWSAEPVYLPEEEGGEG